MTEEVSDSEFDASERRSLRKMHRLFIGNGKAGIQEQIRTVQKTLYVLIGGLGVLAGMVIDGRLRVHQAGPQNQGVVIGSTPHDAAGLGSLRKGAEEFARLTGTVTADMYAILWPDKISVREVTDRCAAGEIPGAYKAADGRWRIPWPPNGVTEWSPNGVADRPPEEPG